MLSRRPYRRYKGLGHSCWKQRLLSKKDGLCDPPDRYHFRFLNLTILARKRHFVGEVLCSILRILNRKARNILILNIIILACNLQILKSSARAAYRRGLHNTPYERGTPFLPNWRRYAKGRVNCAGVNACVRYSTLREIYRAKPETPSPTLWSSIAKGVSRIKPARANRGEKQ